MNYIYILHFINFVLAYYYYVLHVREIYEIA